MIRQEIINDEYKYYIEDEEIKDVEDVVFDILLDAPTGITLCILKENVTVYEGKASSYKGITIEMDSGLHTKVNGIPIPDVIAIEVKDEMFHIKVDEVFFGTRKQQKKHIKHYRQLG